MSGFQFEIQLIAVITAAACALPGVYLVLRRMAMMSDAITHAILPGIVVAFFITHNINSPWLLIGAAATGVITVALVELLYATRRVKEDAAIALVFPVLFSIGVILIARFAGDVHLDLDAVLLGELAFAPFNRWMIGGVDMGPQALYVMLAVGLLNLIFIGAFYKELKIATFDASLAATLGFLPAVLHYALMGMVSLTAVAAFDAVGSILVVALIVGPAAAAHLLTDRLPVMLALSIGIGAISALAGYWTAFAFDASIAGCMAVAVGIAYGLSFLFAPDRGLLAVWSRRKRQRVTFAVDMLLVHLHHHEGTQEETREARKAHLQEHFNWDEGFADKITRRAKEKELVREEGGLMKLTDAGRVRAGEKLAMR